jgi:hypothetical protein
MPTPQPDEVWFRVDVKRTFRDDDREATSADRRPAAPGRAAHQDEVDAPGDRDIQREIAEFDDAPPAKRRKGLRVVDRGRS